MPAICVYGSKIKGTTTGEHHGHVPPNDHPSTSELTGYINGGCSSKVQIMGQPIALYGATTFEEDICGNGNGVINDGTSKILIEGTKVVVVGNKVTPHNGTAVVIEGSPKVSTGG